VSTKKNIYTLNTKELKKLLIAFNKTTYGCTVFFLAYFVPITLLLTTLIVAIVGLCSSAEIFLKTDAICFLSFIVTFVIANIYYYSELRKFAEVGIIKKMPLSRKSRAKAQKPAKSAKKTK